MQLSISAIAKTIVTASRGSYCCSTEQVHRDVSGHPRRRQHRARRDRRGQVCGGGLAPTNQVPRRGLSGREWRTDQSLAQPGWHPPSAAALTSNDDARPLM